MCLLKFEKLSATDLGCHIYIVLFHIACDVGFSSCAIIVGTFWFVSCQTCGRLASVLVWTLLPVVVPKGSAAHDPQTQENKKRENWHMNSKGERWKETESQRGKHIKTRMPHETWRKEERGTAWTPTKRKKKHIPWQTFFQVLHGHQVGHHEFRYFWPGSKT